MPRRSVHSCVLRVEEASDVSKMLILIGEPVLYALPEDCVLYFIFVNLKM